MTRVISFSEKISRWRSWFWKRFPAGKARKLSILWWFQELWIFFTHISENDPIWPIFFIGVETTNWSWRYFWDQMGRLAGHEGWKWYRRQNKNFLILSSKAVWMNMNYFELVWRCFTSPPTCFLALRYPIFFCRNCIVLATLIEHVVWAHT